MVDAGAALGVVGVEACPVGPCCCRYPPLPPPRLLALKLGLRAPLPADGVVGSALDVFAGGLCAGACCACCAPRPSLAPLPPLLLAPRILKSSSASGSVGAAIGVFAVEPCVVWAPHPPCPPRPPRPPLPFPRGDQLSPPTAAAASILGCTPPSFFSTAVVTRISFRSGDPRYGGFDGRSNTRASRVPDDAA